MEPNRIQQLTTRQRECLRLHHQRFRVKEIAAHLGISDNTASGYLTEATAILGVGGRAAAAAALARYEDAHPEARGRFSVGDSPPIGVSEDEAPVALVPASIEQAPTWAQIARWLPFRSGAGNDLSVVQRFIWLGIISFLLVSGLGMFAFFVRTVSDLVAAFRR